MSSACFAGELGFSTHEGRMSRLWEANTGRKIGAHQHKTRYALTCIVFNGTTQLKPQGQALVITEGGSRKRVGVMPPCTSTGCRYALTCCAGGVFGGRPVAIAGDAGGSVVAFFLDDEDGFAPRGSIALPDATEEASGGQGSG